MTHMGHFFLCRERVGHESLSLLFRFAHKSLSVRDPGSWFLSTKTSLRLSIPYVRQAVGVLSQHNTHFVRLCRERESNPHGLLRTILSRVRLPIPPSRRCLHTSRSMQKFKSRHDPLVMPAFLYSKFQILPSALYLSYQIQAWLQRLLTWLPTCGTNIAAVFTDKFCCLKLAY